MAKKKPTKEYTEWLSKLRPGDTVLVSHNGDVSLDEVDSISKTEIVITDGDCFDNITGATIYGAKLVMPSPGQVDELKKHQVAIDKFRGIVLDNFYKFSVKTLEDIVAIAEKEMKQPKQKSKKKR